MLKTWVAGLRTHIYPPDAHVGIFRFKNSRVRGCNEVLPYLFNNAFCVDKNIKGATIEVLIGSDKRNFSQKQHNSRSVFLWCKFSVYVYQILMFGLKNG